MESSAHSGEGGRAEGPRERASPEATEAELDALRRRDRAMRVELARALDVVTVMHGNLEVVLGALGRVNHCGYEDLMPIVDAELGASLSGKLARGADEPDPLVPVASFLDSVQASLFPYRECLFSNRWRLRRQLGVARASLLPARRPKMPPTSFLDVELHEDAPQEFTVLYRSVGELPAPGATSAESELSLSILETTFADDLSESFVVDDLAPAGEEEGWIPSAGPPPENTETDPIRNPGVVARRKPSFTSTVVVLRGKENSAANRPSSASSTPKRPVQCLLDEAIEWVQPRFGDVERDAELPGAMEISVDTFSDRSGLEGVGFGEEEERGDF